MALVWNASIVGWGQIGEDFRNCSSSMCALAGVAQLVEASSCNQRVVGWIPG